MSKQSHIKNFFKVKSADEIEVEELNFQGLLGPKLKIQRQLLALFQLISFLLWIFPTILITLKV